MIVNTSQKTETNNTKIYDSSSKITFIQYGQVIELENELDPKLNKGLGRIKVRIKGPRNRGGDDGLTNGELPWCFPMLPKHLLVQPKKGESVLIFIFDTERINADRLYLGPIISQLPLIENDPYFFSSLNGFTFGYSTPIVNPSLIPELNGVFPNPEDISIQGRYNTDITQKNNEVVIRAGKFIETIPNNNNPFKIKYNPTTQAFIQLKNNVVTNPATNQQAALKGTVANIVANKINLITHRDGSPRFNVTDPDVLITDDELTRILEEAHQVPFGDVLLQYLRLLKDALLNHVHNGSGNPATDLTTDGNRQTVALFKSKANDLENSMLSKNVRIN